MRGRCLALAGLLLLSTGGVLWAGPFSEVPSGDWSYAACARLSGMGLLPPERVGGFSGNPQLTRFEFGMAILDPLSALDEAVSALGGARDHTSLRNAAARALRLDPRASENDVAQAARDLLRLTEEFSDVLASLTFDPKAAVSALRELASAEAVREWRAEALSRPVAPLPTMSMAPGGDSLRMPLAHGTLALSIGGDARSPALMNYFARASAEARASEGEVDGTAEPALRDPTVSRLRTAYEYGLGSALTLSLAYEEIARQGQGLSLLDAASLASLGIGYRLTPSTSLKLSYSLLEYANHVYDTPPVRDRMAETAVSIEF